MYINLLFKNKNFEQLKFYGLLYYIIVKSGCSLMF